MNLPDVYRGPSYEHTGTALMVAADSSKVDRLDLSVIWAIFRRRFRLFFYTAFIIFEFTALLTIWLPSKYTAEADIVLNTPDVPVTPLAQQLPSTDLPTGTEDVDTEIAVLSSHELAAKVVDYLKLYNEPDLRPMLEWVHGPIGRLKYALGITPPLPDVLSPEQLALLRDMIVTSAMRNLDVERLQTAYAVSVDYTDSNQVRAAAIANAFAHLYTQSQIELKQKQNLEAVDVLGARITALRDHAQSDFAALQQYRVAHNLQSTTGASLTEQEISAYNEQVATARAQAAEDEARLETARAQVRNGSSGDDVGEALSSQVVQSLRAQRAAFSAKVADYSTRYGPKSPDLIDARKQLADVDTQIQGEINRVISNLEARSKVSQQRVGSLLQSLATARGTLSQNNEAMVGMADLQRRADTSQALYESYLNRYKEAVAEVGSERAVSRLVSDARVPGSPSFPKPILMLPLGLLLGIGIGATTALIAELLFTGLTTGDEVEQKIGIPYLGGIPLLSSVAERGAKPLPAAMRPGRSAFAEAFRSVLMSVDGGGEGSQVILLSSALPDEGKTTTSACLAQIALSSGYNVIVVDCDSTQRRYSRRYAVIDRRRPGLQEVLRGEAAVEDAIIQSIGGTDLLPVIRPFVRDDEALDRGGFHALIAHLRAKYDIIILDGMPILPMVEARELAEIADKVILLATWRRTSHKALLSAIRLLPADTRGRVGCVLTKIDIKKQADFGPGDSFSFFKAYKKYYTA